jgi:hypothetical protein
MSLKSVYDVRPHEPGQKKLETHDTNAGLTLFTDCSRHSMIETHVVNVTATASPARNSMKSRGSVLGSHPITQTEKRDDPYHD